MGQLIKIEFPCHTLTVRLGSGSYVHCDTKGRTSTPTSFRENLIFSSLFTYSPTPKANKGYLRPPNSNRNLHAKTSTLSYQNASLSKIKA
jgi:DNA-binding transcriptional regulator/RsmH inhibitor MraZ